MSSAAVLAVCVVHAIIPDVGGAQDETAIDKRPVAGPVAVHKLGVSGDSQCDAAHHGREGKAVYAYAQEDANWWSAELDRDLPPGRFGENLRTRGIDVTKALLGERWRIGGTLLEVTCPRTPCLSFQGFWGVPGLIKRFIAYGAPGAYLRVLEEGLITAGDGIEVDFRPDHDVTLGLALRALTIERTLISRMAPALYALPDRDRPKVARLIEGAVMTGEAARVAGDANLGEFRVTSVDGENDLPGRLPFDHPSKPLAGITQGHHHVDPRS